MLGFPYGIANFVRYLPILYLERDCHANVYLPSGNKPDGQVAGRATRSRSLSQTTSPSISTTYNIPTTCLPSP